LEGNKRPSAVGGLARRGGKKQTEKRGTRVILLKKQRKKEINSPVLHFEGNAGVGTQSTENQGSSAMSEENLKGKKKGDIRCQGKN